MKWAVLGRDILTARYEWLQRFLESHHLKNELKIFDLPKDQAETFFNESKDEFDEIRIESPYREWISGQFVNQTMTSEIVGASDRLIKKQKKWWPDSALLYGFNRAFSIYGKGLDLEYAVLVVGSGSGARYAVSAAVRAGFKKINITTQFDDQGLSFIQELKKTYFGAKFEFVPKDRLVLLPGHNVLLINTTPFVASNDLLQELYYLNFLKQDGMIWDLVLQPSETPLIQEGEQLGIQCIRGRTFASLTDHYWATQVLKQELLFSEFESAYESIFPKTYPET